MSKTSIIVDVANQIADHITRGLEINVDTRNNVKMISVRNPRNGDIAEMAFKMPRIGVSVFDKETSDYLKKHGYKETAKATPAATAAGNKTSKWWSRFHFEKNIMKMTLLALQEHFPCEVSFRQDAFAAKLAEMMDWKESTARKHITQAAKLGILNRAVIGTAYHITGVNTDEAQAMREVAVKPDPTPLPGCSLAHEGRILFEQEFEKAVDETVLP